MKEPKRRYRLEDMDPPPLRSILALEKEMFKNVAILSQQTNIEWVEGENN